MPVFNCNITSPPAWSEIDIVRIIPLKKNDVYSINDHKEKETILVGAGKVLLKSNEKVRNIAKNEYSEFNLNENKLNRVIADEDSTVIRIGGRWNVNCGSRGVFELSESDEPKNDGDPVDYGRNTDFDNHYHDCDELWIIYDGSGEIVTEGVRYNVKAGDCVVTKAGDHHDFPLVHETIKGVWFETSLIGEKREGHLWRHTHSKGNNL